MDSEDAAQSGGYRRGNGELTSLPVSISGLELPLSSRLKLVGGFGGEIVLRDVDDLLRMSEDETGS